MRRRDVLAMAVAAAMAMTASGACASPGRRVGFVFVGAEGGWQIRGLRQGLAERGFVDGRDLVIEERYAHGRPDKAPALIGDLLARGVDVLVTVGTPTSLAAHEATKTVPIVCVTGDPVSVGLAESLARPGGNVTGLSLLGAEYSAKWLGLLKTAAPSIARAGLLWNPESSVGRLEMKRVQAAAAALAMTATPLSVQPDAVEASFAEIEELKVDSLVVFDDALCGAYLQRIVELSAKRRLPALYGFDEAVRLGGLMSYSTNFFEIWRRAGYHVARILQGARAAELPIEQATEIALRLNLKAAAQLGLDMPQSLLAAAAEVIE